MKEKGEGKAKDKGELQGTRVKVKDNGDGQDKGEG